MSINKRLRFQILNRDGFTCVYCGRQAPDVALHVDHRMPVSRGGTNHPSNLCAACVDCNLGKSAHPLEAPVERFDFLEDYDDAMQFVMCDPYITSLYGELVV